MEQAIKKDDRTAGIILIFLRPRHKTTPNLPGEKYLLLIFLQSCSVYRSLQVVI